MTKTEEKITFGPGEYRIYTSERITPPGGYITSVFDVPEARPIDIWPNPVASGEEIYLNLDPTLDIESVSLVSIDGRSVNATMSDGQLLPATALSAGMYVIQIVADKALYTGKLVVVE